MIKVSCAIAAVMILLAGSRSLAQNPPSDLQDNEDFRTGAQVELRREHTRPAFAGATERWTCAIRSRSGEMGIMYFGVYSGYAQTGIWKLPIIGNTKGALIIADSSYGESDYTGQPITQYLRAIIIDRHSYTIKRLFVNAPDGKSSVEDGQCSRD